ncbi:hypothetical protein BKA64DRAFT_710180 [Cadophora sp. MPI-SDFR-AT-0126]|nr:hypothetical protein BKA64DRAFT_710180 [Leotiomycetes sp. MPI-SDFR-AT-0126]
MAVLATLPGIRVTICVDGDMLKEYPAENTPIKHDNPAVISHQESCTVTKFVEATTGQSFTINIAVNEPFEMTSPSVMFHVFADGQIIRKPLMMACAYKNLEWKRIVEGLPAQVNGSKSTILPLRFSKIAYGMAGDDIPKTSIDNHVEIIGKVGEIVVKMYRANSTRTGGLTPSKFAQTDFDTTKYHTKAVVKNSQSHGVSFGAPKLSKAITAFASENLDGSDFPVAIFRFVYRSRSALQSLMVIPASPSPSPSPSRSPSTEPEPEPEPSQNASPPDTPSFPRLTSIEEFERQQKEDRETFMRLHRMRVTPNSVTIPPTETTPKIKPEAATIPSPVIKSEKVATPKVKREREDDNPTPTPTPKKKKPNVTIIIDLTEDDEKDAITVE